MEPLADEFSQELTVIVFNTLKEKYPNIDDATLMDIIEIQKNLYCSYLDQKYGFKPA
jgi:hypothetical protein